MSSRYLDDELFADWLRDGIGGNRALNEQSIAAAEQQLDRLAGRSFQVAADTGTARKFRPKPGAGTLFIPDAAVIESVVENGTTLTVDVDFEPAPFNNLDPVTGNYRPYDRLHRLDAAWYSYGDSRSTVTVTARWGWATVPMVIVEACKVLAADWLSNRDAQVGTIGLDGNGFAIGVRRNPFIADAVKVMSGAGVTGIG